MMTMMMMMNIIAEQQQQTKVEVSHMVELVVNLQSIVFGDQPFLVDLALECTLSHFLV